MPYYSITGGGGYTVDQYPAECPRCSRLISPIATSIAAFSVENEAELLFRCPNCLRFIVAIYSHHENSVQPFRFIRSAPASAKIREFPLIDKISVRFAALFNQSFAAETFGLDEIAGTGYRKALEFLVKDFAIALAPSEVNAIRRKFLKPVIDDHIPSGKLKTAATLTTWLGNHEGHYERRWIDTDLQDLKALLELTITFVSEEVQLEQYVKRMKPDEPPKLSFVTETNM